MRVVKFFDIAVRPPKGGWRVVIDGVKFDGNSEAEILSSVSQWARNNDISSLESEADVEAAVWRYYCNNDPTRCRVSGGKPDDNPPATEVIANFAKAIIRTVAAVAHGEPVISTNEQKVDRRAICAMCPRFEVPSEKCLECGCFLKFKTALAQEHCPLGRW